MVRPQPLQRVAVLGDDGQSYLQRFGKGTLGAGWYSFDRAASTTPG